MFLLLHSWGGGNLGSIKGDTMVVLPEQLQIMKPCQRRHSQKLSLLTELGNVFRRVFYKDVATTAL